MPGGRTSPHPAYRYGIPIFPPVEKGEEERAWEAAREALAAYRELLRLARAGLTPMLAQRVDRIQQLTHEFQSKWGLWFPVPPRVGGRLPRLYASPDPVTARQLAADIIPKSVPQRWPERLMTSTTVKPVRELSSTESHLTLDLWLPAGNLVFDFVGGRLDHVQKHDDSSSSSMETTPRPMGRRSARKGPKAGHVSVEPGTDGWVRLEIHNPGAVHLAQVRGQLSTYLQRAPFTFQTAPEPYGQMFLMVRERTHRATKAQKAHGTGQRTGCLTRSQIAERLCLRGGRGEHVSNLIRVYGQLCEKLGLPPASL
jgi:hypothetical protein